MPVGVKLSGGGFVRHNPPHVHFRPNGIRPAAGTFGPRGASHI